MEFLLFTIGRRNCQGVVEWSRTLRCFRGLRFAVGFKETIRAVFYTPRDYRLFVLLRDEGFSSLHRTSCSMDGLLTDPQRLSQRSD